MSRDNDRRNGGLGEFAILASVLLFGFFVQPGLLAVYGTRQMFGLHLDRGQLWTFGAVTSLAVYATFAVRKGGMWEGLGRYSLLCIAASTTLVVAHWGLHAQWPRDLWALLFGN
jgi:hypothetical protein